MHAHHIDLENLLWFAGWLAAVGVLFALALGLPLQTRLTRFGARVYAGAVFVGVVGVAVLANLALSLHDVYLDLTREEVFTPSAAAMSVVDRLQRPVALTYFYQGQDQNGRRAADMVEVMGRRNPLLQVRTVDPDTEPSLARSAGRNLYNAAVLTSGGRKVTVNSTDETDIAIGIQRVLRERVVTVCFLEGHKEYPMDAFEFHTHFDGSPTHDHDDSSSAVVQTTDHGVGRLRRVLEGLGYDVQVITPAIEGSIPLACSAVVNAGPRTTYLPEETRALERYLEQGGSLLALFDLGFVLEPGLARLMERLGVQVPQSVLIDPKSHYGKDPETVAVTAYDPHPITRPVSLTFFPGARPLALVTPQAGISTQALVTTSTESYTLPVEPLAQRAIESPAAPADSHPHPHSDGVAHDHDHEHAQDHDHEQGEDHDQGEPASRPIAAAIEGKLSEGVEQTFRVVVVGDADFASNSFIAYMANSDLTLSMLRWLVREEHSTAIASRIPVPPVVLLNASQTRNIFLVLVVAMPLGVMLLGAFVWWRRR